MELRLQGRDLRVALAVGETSPFPGMTSIVGLYRQCQRNASAHELAT
jgi:hypothetical protein